MKYSDQKSHKDIHRLALERLRLPTKDQLKWIENKYKVKEWGVPIPFNHNLILVKGVPEEIEPLLQEINSNQNEFESVRDVKKSLHSQNIEYDSRHSSGLFICEKFLLSHGPVYHSHNAAIAYKLNDNWSCIDRNNEASKWECSSLESWMIRELLSHRDTELVPIILRTDTSFEAYGFPLGMIGETVPFERVLDFFELEWLTYNGPDFLTDEVGVYDKMKFSWDVTKWMKVEFEFANNEFWQLRDNGEFYDILLLRYEEEHDCLFRYKSIIPNKKADINHEIVNPSEIWVFGAKDEAEFKKENYYWEASLEDFLIDARLSVRLQRLHLQDYCQSLKKEVSEQE